MWDFRSADNVGQTATILFKLRLERNVRHALGRMNSKRASLYRKMSSLGTVVPKNPARIALSLGLMLKN